MKLTAKAQSMDPTGTSVIPAISLTAGKLDITNNALVVNYTGASPINSIKQLVAAASITSSSAGVNQVIGIGEASAMNLSSFGGATLDATAVVVRLTMMADANLDGRINSLDFNALAGAFNQSGQNWNNGDFNGDGMVNALDFNAIATYFGQSMPAPLPAESFGQLVPEPGTIGLVSLSLLLARRRKRV
jgi:hypothetical protein